MLETERPATLYSRGVSVSGAPSPEYLPALTGLRFWAAFHVFLFHLVHRDTIVGRIIAAGPMSVSLFFVLSGFILARVYLAAGRFAGVRAFLVARFARIYPVYLLGILLVILLEFLPPPVGLDRGLVSWRSVIESVLLVQAWDPVVACSLNCPGWSLSDEAFFYLTFPIAGALLLRLGTRGAWTALAAAAAVTFALGLPFLADRALYRPYADLFGGLPDPVFMYHPVVRLPEFLFGAALGVLTLRSQGLRAWVNLHSQALAVTAMTLILTIYAIPSGLTFKALSPAFLLPLFGALILALAFPSAEVERIFANRLAHRVGEWSYAIYILHIPVLLFYSNLDLQWWVTWNATGLLLRIVTVIGLAGVAYQFLELPARRWLRGRLGHPSA